mgnify:CR=1 FL=1
MKKPFKQRLTYLLAAGLVLAIFILGGYILQDRFWSAPVEIKNVSIDPEAALKLNIIKQISKKNGITEWELNAESATLLKDKHKAVLKTVTVIFFTRDKKKVRLTARTGSLDTKTHDMTFFDDVVVAYEDAVLRTDKLQYNKKGHIIRSDAHVRLERGRSVIEADSMETRLSDSTIILNGHVKGSFSEDFKIQ